MQLLQHTQSSTSGPQQLQNRTCTECRRRKVRCNRLHPCSNCVAHESPCVFPRFRQPTRMPRRAKGIAIPSQQATPNREQSQNDGNEREDVQRKTGSFSMSETDSHSLKSPSASIGTSYAVSVGGSPEQKGPVTHLNLLEGRSRYIGNHFWTSMSNEVEEMQDVLDESSSERETASRGKDSSDQLEHESRYSFFFTTTNNQNSITQLMPSTNQLLSFFDLYQENVDPVARVFHRPTLQKVITGVMNDPSRMTKTVQAVIFSICFAAVVSVDETECCRLFGEEQRRLLNRYRFGVEQSLSRARFVESVNFNVLSALVLFLLTVRRYDHSRFVSGMLGVAIRNAQAMGLHRDGTHHGLSSLETDLRRRLWWHICMLDLRTSEDHGFEPSLFEHNYDTKLPLNVEDDDFTGDGTEPVSGRSGWSSMVFSLLRFEMTIAIKRLHYRPPGLPRDNQPDPRENEKYVEEVGKLFHDYMDRCDVTNPIQWVSATWAHLMLTKLWLAAVNPLQTHGRIVPMYSRQVAFSRAVEVLELSDTLETSPRAVRWRWLFLTHTQWHIVVFVLAYICVVHTDPLWERAWVVVGKVSRRWSANLQAKAGMLWKPLDRLMAKADQVRKAKSTKHQHLASIEATSASSVEAAEHIQSGNYPQSIGPLRAKHALTAVDVGPEPSYHHDLPNEAAVSQPDIEVYDKGMNFDTDESQFLSGFGGDRMAIEPMDSEWDELMRELEFDIQSDAGIPLSDLSGTVQGHASNFWDML